MSLSSLSNVEGPLPARSLAQLQGSCRQLQLVVIRFSLHPKCSQVKSIQVSAAAPDKAGARAAAVSPTHFCSPAAGHSRSSPPCRGGSFHPRCDTGTSRTPRSSCRRPLGQWCRCCCCTGTAGRHRQPHRGSQRSQTHIHHSDCLLEQTGTVGIAITAR